MPDIIARKGHISGIFSAGNQTGQKWLNENIVNGGQTEISVQVEFYSELVEKMKEAGLDVEER